MRNRTWGWPFPHPPNTDFDINLNSWQADGLVFWLPLMGPRREPYLDRVNVLELTPYNSPVWTSDGWLGNALLFDDGSSQYLYVGDAVASTAPLTMACWVNSDDITLNQSALAINSEDDNTLHGYWLHLRGGEAGDYVQFRVFGSGGSGFTATTSGYSANTWHHICGIEYATDSRAAFIDGGSKGTNSTDITPASLDNTVIGAQYAWNGAANQVYSPMSGTIADVRIYNRALSDEEVAELYNPETRWELYQPRVPLWTVGALAGATVPVWSSPANHATMGASPVLEFTSAAFSGNAHFHMQLDTANSFDSGNLRGLKTNHDVTGWTYWDGDSWEAFQSSGMPDTFSGNNVRYEVQTPLSTGTWYRRVRQG